VGVSPFGQSVIALSFLMGSPFMVTVSCPQIVTGREWFCKINKKQGGNWH